MITSEHPTISPTAIFLDIRLTCSSRTNIFSTSTACLFLLLERSGLPYLRFFMVLTGQSRDLLIIEEFFRKNDSDEMNVKAVSVHHLVTLVLPVYQEAGQA